MCRRLTGADRFDLASRAASKPALVDLAMPEALSVLVGLALGSTARAQIETGFGFRPRVVVRLFRDKSLQPNDHVPRKLDDGGQR